MLTPLISYPDPNKPEAETAAQHSHRHSHPDGSLAEPGLELGLEEVFMFDSESENRDRAVEAVEAVSEARAF